MISSPRARGPGAENGPAKSSRLRAVVLSVALHAVLILGASGIPWLAHEPPDPERFEVVLVRGLPPAEDTPARVRAAAARAASVPSPVDVPREPPEPVLPPDTPEPVPPDAPEPVAPAPAPPEREVPAPVAPERGVPEPEAPEPVVPADIGREGDEDPPEPAVDETRSPRAPEAEERERLAPGADFEAEMRRAARQVVEQKAREGEYPTFSLDDLDEEPAPEEPGPERSVFESSPGLRGPSLLSPEKARGRVGRWVAEKCERITGGMGLGLFGLGFSLCASSDARNDLFSTIKPDYLKARPQCTEVTPAGPAADGAAAPKKTHDCRLVVEE